MGNWQKYTESVQKICRARHVVADYSKESRQVSALTLKMKLEIPDQVEQLPKRKKKDNVSAFGNLKALSPLS